MSTIYEDMQQVAVRVLEEWAMMLVEPAGQWQELFNAEKTFFVGRLEFHGLVSGIYSVVCQEEFGRSLAANLLGGEEETGPAQISDAVCEMVNVLSGNLLTSCYGEDSVFDLSSPYVQEVQYEDLETIIKGYSLCYMADDQPVVITFTPQRINDGH